MSRYITDIDDDLNNITDTSNTMKVVIFAEGNTDGIVWNEDGIPVSGGAGNEFIGQAVAFANANTKIGNQLVEYKIIGGKGYGQLSKAFQELNESGFVTEGTKMYVMGHSDSSGRFGGVAPEGWATILKDNQLYNSFDEAYYGACWQGQHGPACTDMSSAFGDDTTVYAQTDQKWGSGDTYNLYLDKLEAGGGYSKRYQRPTNFMEAAFTVGSGVVATTGYNRELIRVGAEYRLPSGSFTQEQASQLVDTRHLDNTFQAYVEEAYRIGATQDTILNPDNPGYMAEPVNPYLSSVENEYATEWQKNKMEAENLNYEWNEMIAAEKGVDSYDLEFDQEGQFRAVADAFRDLRGENEGQHGINIKETDNGRIVISFEEFDESTVWGREFDSKEEYDEYVAETTETLALYNTTTLENGEIMLDIQLPRQITPDGDELDYFEIYGRRESDMTMVTEPKYNDMIDSEYYDWAQESVASNLPLERVPRREREEYTLAVGEYEIYESEAERLAESIALENFGEVEQPGAFFTTADESIPDVSEFTSGNIDLDEYKESDDFMTAGIESKINQMQIWERTGNQTILNFYDQAQNNVEALGVEPAKTIINEQGKEQTISNWEEYQSLIDLEALNLFSEWASEFSQ